MNKNAIYNFIIYFFLANLIVTQTTGQVKYFLQKPAIFSKGIGIDGNASFPRNDLGGIVIDFDNDGNKDFIIPSYFSPQGNFDVQYLRFLKNGGNGQFKEVTDSMINPENKIFGKYLVGMNDRRGVTLDFNKDGKMDFIFPTAWENQDYTDYDSIYGYVKMKDYFFKSNPSNYIESRANGGYGSPTFFYQKNGTFYKGYDLFDTKTFTVDADVETADMNNDGWDDIIIYGGGYKAKEDFTIVDKLGGITIWMNNNGKGFKFNHIKLVDTIKRFSFGFLDEGKIAIEDFNDDGYKDMLLYGVNSPYKPRGDISKEQQDSVLWDANYITVDTIRSNQTSYESRIYFSNKGVFESSNYIIIPNLKATFPSGIDLNNDGKKDILAVWKNYRAGPTMYTDSTTNKDGFNNRYYTFINKGNNLFEDKTSEYFPNNTYKFSRLGRGDFYYTDIDGDGKNDFIPLSQGDDTLGTQYGTFSIDPILSNQTVYYKNIDYKYFKKVDIDSFSTGDKNTPYFLNHLYINDLNGDGINELLGISIPWTLKSMIRTEAPILDSYIKSTCGTDSISSHTVRITNLKNKDTIIWNYNGIITKSVSDSFEVKNFGWLVAKRKDSSGIISFNSDTVIIKRSAKPLAPRIYFSSGTKNDVSKLCIGDTVVLASEQSSLDIPGKIIWYDENKVKGGGWTEGGVGTYYESTGTRNYRITSYYKINWSSTNYTRFESNDGCLSDFSEPFKVTINNLSPPQAYPVNYCVSSEAKALTAKPSTNNILLWYGTNSIGGTAGNTAPIPLTKTIGSTNYYVSQKDTLLGCESPRAKIEVKVSPLPTKPNFTPTIFSFCSGDSIKLSITNVNKGDTLKWYFGTKSDITNVDNKYFNDSMNVFVTRTNSLGCIISSDTIQITKLSTPIKPEAVNSISYCLNASVVALSATASSGNSLRWFGSDSTGGTSTTTATVPSSSKVGTFDYYVSQVSSSNACESPRTKITVKVNPLPSKPTFNTSKYSFCSGDSLKLSVTNASKGDTLKWYFDTKSDFTNIANKTFTDSSKVFVTRTDSLGCMISSDTIQLKKYAIPSSPSLVRDTANNLVASTNGITWYKDGVKISDTTQKIKPTSNGIYTATTSQNGCTSNLSQGYYYLTNAVSNLSNDEYFKISPNPTSGELNINYKISSSRNITISVFDINGRSLILNKKVESGSKINLGSVSKGNYIVQVKDGSGKIITSQKLVKE